jgi:hypothetical protein
MIRTSIQKTEKDICIHDREALRLLVLQLETCQAMNGEVGPSRGCLTTTERVVWNMENHLALQGLYYLGILQVVNITKQDLYYIIIYSFKYWHKLYILCLW